MKAPPASQLTFQFRDMYFHGEGITPMCSYQSAIEIVVLKNVTFFTASNSKADW